MINPKVIIVAVAAICVSVPASASEMVYHPVNPTFGGNPLNGSFLLSTAQAQGEGVKSGSQGPDLSGLNNALSNLGSAVVIGGSGTNSGSTNNSSGGTVP
ncbi:curli assembly protein CsgF [Bradyrhizobium sp.]|uniref:curli assembly protein CsgF n=1 Tax=Bradyrhizobium sp. TaxID=376 RepID=UPI003C37CC82